MKQFKEDTQARWMDWVCEGNKYNVEYNFGKSPEEMTMEVKI